MTEGETFIIGVYVEDLGESILLRSENHPRLREKMYLDRSAGVSENLLQKFSMDKAKPVSTLVIVNTKLKMVSVDEMYRNAVGSLLYLLTRTRPDMAFAVTLPNSIEQL